MTVVSTNLSPILLSAFFTLALGVGCAQSLETNTTSSAAEKPCAAGTAQFLILDGIQKTICGCQEPGVQVVSAGSGSITCTVSAGTVVFFHFMGAQLTHQIVPTNGPGFPASLQSDPAPISRVVPHAFTLSVAGTYGYKDAFNPGINGQIIVQ